MLKVDNTPLNTRSHFTQWAEAALGIPGVQIQIRCQGNNLHILCESTHPPDKNIAVSQFLRAIDQTNLDFFMPKDQATIYHQIFLYGRKIGKNIPAWMVEIDLNAIDRHLEALKSGNILGEINPNRWAALAKTTEKPTKESSHQTSDKPAMAVLVADDRLLIEADRAEVYRQEAQTGKPEAIARYLSAILSNLGVAIKVKTELKTNSSLGRKLEQEQINRLWVFCSSAYSPDPLLLSEPIAQRLRNLKLQKFQDALILFQVQGETSPDWILRVDLTPIDEMLEKWAKWGDGQALARLINNSLASIGVEVRAVMKEFTLHLFCTLIKTEVIQRGEAQAPEQQTVMAIINPLLNKIAPQGLQAATIYGLNRTQFNPQNTINPDKEAPAWIDWVNLPAQKDPLKAASTRELAKAGDIEALTFLLDRLLNPNLDRKLAIGGIRIQILPKEDILHLMVSAPVCPVQSQVAPQITNLLKSLAIKNIAGIRIYGRRSGEKQPLWRYGLDFRSVSSPKVTETIPEFTSDRTDVAEDLQLQNGQIILRPPITTQRGKNPTKQEHIPLILQVLAQLLIASQLFVTSNNTLANPTRSATLSRKKYKSKNAAIAVIWATLGLLLALQTDWLVGEMLTGNKPGKNPEANNNKTTIANNNTTQATETVALPQIALQKNKDNEEGIFNSSTFTQTGITTNIDVNKPRNQIISTPPKKDKNQGETSAQTPTQKIEMPLLASPLQPSAAQTAMIAATRSPFPSFRSRQLDEKLALYQQRVARKGPPDVMVIGSSRTLRGIDPIALEKALAMSGYGDIEVFNFGINGATAQVVDLIIRQILPPEQLPKLIIWADGARAFNSGRVDITYNAIAASEGYKKIVQTGILPEKQQQKDAEEENSTTAKNANNIAVNFAPVTSNYDSLNQLFNDKLGKFSATYSQRDKLKNYLLENLVKHSNLKDINSFYANQNGQIKPEGEKANIEDEENTNPSTIDINGFLPLSIRFQATTYYQKHPRVSGDYDRDYQNFQMEGKQINALSSLMQYTQQRQIPVVFVNLPLTQDYLDPIRKAYEQQFQQQMLRLAPEKGFIFTDLSQAWPNQHDFFSDPSHLNRYGAYNVSQRLAKEPAISWPKSKGLQKTN